MSADNIGICPSCGEQELREFFEFYTDADHRRDYEAKPVTVTASYQCHCHACEYRFEFEHTENYPLLSPTAVPESELF